MKNSVTTPDPYEAKFGNFDLKDTYKKEFILKDILGHLGKFNSTMEICAGNLIPSQPSIKIEASEVRGKTIFKKVSTSTASFQQIRGEFLIGGKDACKVSNTWLF